MEPSWSRISKLARKHERDIAKLCRDLVSADTQNPPGDTRGAVGVAADFLNEVGCRSRTVGVSKEKANLVCTVGAKRGRIVFCSHLDVVPPGNRANWKREPFEPYVKGGKIFGRGAADAKGPAAAMLWAVRFLASEYERELATKGLTLALVCDEEIGGYQGTRWLIRNGHVRGSACLIGEPTYVNKDVARVIIGERGLVWFRFTSKGRPAHASMPPLGENAIMKLLPLLSRIHAISVRKRDPPVTIRKATRNSRDIMRLMAQPSGSESASMRDTIDHYTVSVGTIHGGTKTNVVPDLCQAEVDIRIPIGGSVQEATRFVKRILGSQLGVEVTNQSNPSYTAETDPLVRLTLSAARAIIHANVAATLAPYTSDAHWFRELLSIPTCNFGPGYEFHVYDEFVPVRQLTESVVVYASAALN